MQIGTFFKKYKVEILVIALAIVVYFASRLITILSLPIFTDEAIYIRWSQIAKQDADWRFISLTDGKQPSFIWITMILMRFIEDPLLAGRLVSVLAGFASMVGLFFLGKELFQSKWIGILSSFMYVIFPMALVYDRMALYDSLVGTFAVWGLYFAVLLVRNIRLDTALILGMVIGGGALTKTNGFFTLYLLPITLFLFDWKHKNAWRKFFRWTGLAAVALILTYSFYSILRLSPFFHIIEQKNAVFVYPLEEWVDHPFNFFIGNWKAFWDWLVRYMTWPALLLVASSFFITKNYLREKLLLFIWFLVPIIALALFGKTLYPRFIFFMTLSLLPLVAFSLFQLQKLIKNRMLFAFCFLLFAFLQIRADYLIVTNFARAPLPSSDLDQYINSWPAGGGIKESIEFFEKEARKGKIYIATQGTFGLLPYAYEIYLVENPNIKIEGFWPIEDLIPAKAVEQSKKIPSYFVFYQHCNSCSATGIAPISWNVEKVMQIKKETNSYLTVYKIR